MYTRILIQPCVNCTRKAKSVENDMDTVTEEGEAVQALERMLYLPGSRVRPRFVVPFEARRLGVAVSSGSHVTTIEPRPTPA